MPKAPRNAEAMDSMCRGQIRRPESIADRAVTRAGWFLYGPAQTYGTVTLIKAMASADGMCRPNEYNAFVFVGSRFAGTLSPTVSGARADGSIRSADLYDAESLVAEFNRYTSNDALCCPSQKTTVRYTITSGSRPVVKVEDLTTEKSCREEGGGVETQDNVVSGTVTYRQRSALPPNAVVTVRLVDVSRQDVSAPVIAEQRIETNGRQVPIEYGMAYDRSKIQERNRYAVRAEIRSGSRLLFTTADSYPVITQGNPRNVEITVVPVGGGGRRSGVIRGTVRYLQRSALPANSEVIVRLVDAASASDAAPVAETTFSTGTRQVPFSFELTYEPREIERERNYELRAEIRSGGKILFRTETGKAVNLRRNELDGVELILSPASEGAEAITGKSLSLSKFGAGSLQIGTRDSEFIIRGSVTVGTDGKAEVGVSSIGGTFTFSGKLTYFDDTTLRITVQNSGDADASGEIEVKYNGRSLRSLSSNDLVLDGQDVSLRF